jgi:hypothetical protein
MTEADELTIQRFAAICRGMDKGIERFEQMYGYLRGHVHNRHFRMMQRYEETGKPQPEETLRVFATVLFEVDMTQHVAKGRTIPRFLRNETHGP